LDTEIESVAKYVTTGITYGGLGAVYSTYADLPDTISYNSAYWSAETPILSVIQSDHKLYTLTGAPASTSLRTGIVGDDEKITLVSRVKGRFTTAPTSSTMDIEYSNDFGTTFTPYDTVSMTNNTYDFLNCARWHRFTQTFVGTVEILGNVYDIQEAGSE